MSADLPSLVPIVELNTLSEAGFAAALEPLFEAAGPLASALRSARPFASYDDLLDRASSAIASLPVDQQVEVINAHPRIGDSADVVRATSTLSYAEQGYSREAAIDQAALDRTYRELAELNARYEAYFGFRFVVFVNGRPKSAIVDVMRERLHSPLEREMATALADMLAIARDRLSKLSAT